MRRDVVRTAGILLGIGMGGFLDGILFHQIFQLHNMLSAVYYPDTLIKLEINMFWDGLFHAFTWLTTALGIWLLWRGCREGAPIPSTRGFVGSLLFGWGIFNFIEGLLDHHILEIHHVVERLGSSAWDLLFLASGVALTLLGRSLMKEGTVKSP